MKLLIKSGILSCIYTLGIIGIILIAFWIINGNYILSGITTFIII